MKKDIHPEYNFVKVIMTDGTTYTTRSTSVPEGGALKLDIDPTGHPAWTGGTGRLMKSGQLDRFNKRFASFGLK